MFEDRLLAGVIAGIPISLLCLGYVVVRRDVVVVELFTENGGSDALLLGVVAHDPPVPPMDDDHRSRSAWTATSNTRR